MASLVRPCRAEKGNGTHGTSAEIIAIGNKNITVYSTPALGNAQLKRGQEGSRVAGGRGTQ